MLFLARSLEYSTRKIVTCVLMGTYSLQVVLRLTSLFYTGNGVYISVWNIYSGALAK